MFIYPIGLVFTLVCVVISTIFKVSPAFLFGIPLLVHVTSKLSSSDKKTVRLSKAIGGASIFLLGIIFWLISPLFQDNQVVFTFLLTSFLVIIEGVFFELLPIDPLFGAGLWKKNKLIWSILAFPVGFIFFHTINNPNSTLDQLAQSNNVPITFLVLTIYSLFAFAFWWKLGRTTNLK